jgi:hypothetical protein
MYILYHDKFLFCEISGSHGGGGYEDGWLSSGLLRRVVW